MRGMYVCRPRVLDTASIAQAGIPTDKEEN